MTPTSDFSRWGILKLLLGLSTLVPGALAQGEWTGPVPTDTAVVDAALETSTGLPPAANSVQALARYVGAVYQVLLGRPADPAGVQNFAAALRRGTTRTQLVWGILQSPERGRVVTSNFYQQLLNRPAGPEEAQAGATALANGATIEQLEASILGSVEFYDRICGRSDQAFLAIVYPLLLARAVDESGRTHFTAGLSGGLPRSDVAQAILGSVEEQLHLADMLYRALLERPVDETASLALNRPGAPAPGMNGFFASILGSDEYFRHVTGFDPTQAPVDLGTADGPGVNGAGSGGGGAGSTAGTVAAIIRDASSILGSLFRPTLGQVAGGVSRPTPAVPGVVQEPVLPQPVAIGSGGAGGERFQIGDIGDGLDFPDTINFPEIIEIFDPGFPTLETLGLDPTDYVDDLLPEISEIFPPDIGQLGDFAGVPTSDDFGDGADFTFPGLDFGSIDGMPVDEGFYFSEI